MQDKNEKVLKMLNTEIARLKSREKEKIYEINKLQAELNELRWLAGGVEAVFNEIKGVIEQD